jgi:Ca-activated chloride channel family protein
MNNWLSNTGLQFADGWVLWALLLIPIYWFVLYRWEHFFSAPLKIASHLLTKGIKSPVFNPKKVQHIFRSLALFMCIVALARPQLKLDATSELEQYTEGIDIIISLDASGSMEAEDFSPNRFEAAKKVAQDFVSKRKNDRIGLVIFEGEAYTQCPLTADKNVLIDIIGETQRNVVDGGTAIGMGLATAVNRLRESDSESKVIILLTDGVNTHGKIHPMTAAEIAQELGVRVYTIGVGTNGKAKTPIAINPVTGKYIYDYVDVEIDEKLLKEISAMTGGKYFRATDNEKLKEIYAEIDVLEKHIIKSTVIEVDLPEKSMPFILLGLIFLMLEVFTRTFFKSVS